MKKVYFLLTLSILANIAFAVRLTNSEAPVAVEDPEIVQVNSCEKYSNRGSIAEWVGGYESLADLKNRSEAVVVATVVDCGYDPAGLVGDLQSVLFHFDIKQVIKGEVAQGEVSVVYQAGARNGTGQLTYDTNELTEGQEVVLFLKQFTSRNENYAINGGASTAVLTQDESYSFHPNSGIAGGIGSFVLSDLE